MPIFEYKCVDCNNKFEILHKSSVKEQDIVCPDCNSSNNKKLFSAFSASVNSTGSISADSCSAGNCGIPESTDMGGCASGLCNLN